MLKGAAHITGGGITDNTPRILPAGLAARVDVSTWTIPPIFEQLRAIGNIDLADYRRTFNLGIGMILVVAKRNLAKARGILARLRRAVFRDRRRWWSRAAHAWFMLVVSRVKRLGILLSGRGSNFEAIADNVAAGRLDAEIAVVISNRPEARGLEIARERGIAGAVHSFQRRPARRVRPAS